MNAKQNLLGSKNRNGRGGWWMAGALVVTAALAISVAVTNAPIPHAEPPNRLQTFPGPEVLGYIRAYKDLSASTNQLSSDADTQAVLAYMQTHSVAPAYRAQIVPDGYTQAVMLYLRAFGLGPGVSSEQP